MCGFIGKMRYIMIVSLLSTAFSFDATASVITLATVQMNQPVELHTLQVGASIYNPATGTGPSSYWHTLPAPLNSGTLKFEYLNVDPSKTTGAVDYGQINFTVLTTGPVWMMTPDAFPGGGNASGNWIPQLSNESQLQAAGWMPIDQGIVSEGGYGPAGTNQNFGNWLIFERQSTAGEQFAIRTQKYQSPVILQGTSVAVPEPTNAIVPTICLLMQMAKRRRNSRD